MINVQFTRISNGEVITIDFRADELDFYLKMLKSNKRFNNVIVLD